MPRRCLNWNGPWFALAALLFLANGACTRRVDPPLVETDPSVETDLPLAEADRPKHLPENIVAAWKGAGPHVQVGWMQMGSWGLTFSEGEKAGKPGDLPAFYFVYGWEAGSLAKLPAPASAFGLTPSTWSGAKPVDVLLKDLAGLTTLQALNLSGTGVTDAGLKAISGLTSLQTLNLSGTGVTDAGLKELAGLTNLQSLKLAEYQVTDAGLKELAGLKSLQSLNLVGSRVTDAGLKELAGLKSLQVLLLGLDVTDAGLKELAGLTSLQQLHLSGSLVTDAGLKELAGLKSLQKLNLHATKVTDAGLKDLQQALPACRISR